MATNTDGVAAAEKVATETVQPTEAPATPASDSGAQDRINALVAERNRKDEQNKKLAEEIEALKEAHKTEDDKRIDSLVQERLKAEYGDKLQRLDQYETGLSAKRDKLLAEIPEEHRALVDSNATTFTQVQQAEGVLKLLGVKAPQSTGGAVNPAPPPGKPTFTWNEWTEFQQLPYKGTQEALQEYDKQKEAMFEAYREGRISRA